MSDFYPHMDTAGFLPSFVIFSMWIGFGVHTCLTLLATAYQQRLVRIPRVAVYTFLFGSVAATLGGAYMRHLVVTDQTGNYSSRTLWATSPGTTAV